MSPTSVRSLGSLSTPAQLIPPRAYRPLAWLGLVANGLTIPLVLAVILLDPTWRITHIALGAGAVLPCAALGIVASVACISPATRGWAPCRPSKLMPAQSINCVPVQKAAARRVSSS